MLTPSNVTVADFNTAVKNDAPSHIKMTFTGQNIVLEDEDIEVSGMVLQNLLNADTDLTFGKAVMSSLNVNILNSNKLNNIDWNGEFKLEIGVEVGGSTEYITLGYFTGSRPEKVTNVDVISFTANDRMQKFDILADEWLASLTYPKTVAQMYASLCTYVGISSESGNELANIMSRSFSAAPITNTGLLCRDVLSAIAEACGCYAKIASSGKVKMVWFTDQTGYVLTGDDEFSADGFDVSLADVDTITGIDGVSVKQTEDDIGVEVPSGATGNIYLIVDNPFLVTANASEVTSYITPIYNRLNALGGYLPCSVQCIGNPLVEAGDIITAYVNGQSVSMPIFVKNLHWNSRCTDSYEATGNMKREAVKTSDRQKLSQGGRYHKFKNDIETLESEIGDAQGNISQLQQDVGGLSTRVQSAEGNISSVQQQANRIDATVTQKTRVFYGSTTPTGTTADPVISGDLWVDTAHNNALKRYNGSSWVDASYDDPDIATISLAVQKKARVYYSNTAPSGSTSDPLVTGDLWIDTAHNNQLKRYNGSSWVDASFDDPDKYTVYSGIDITSNGIDITGSKYVKIRSGGTFDVDSTNFKISSTDAEIQFGNLTDGRWQINGNGLFFAKEGPITGSHLSNTIRVSAANSFEFYFGEDVFGDFYTYIMGSGKFYGYNSYVTTEPVGPDLGSTTYPWETLYVKNIAYADSNATYDMIKFKSGNAYGHGVGIGGGGFAIIGGGESVDKAIAETAGDTEVLYLCNDGNVNIFTNMQNSWADRKTFTFDTAGTLTLANGNITISHSASADMSAGSSNPKITFSDNTSQPVHLIYTDFDSYRFPAGLKVVGGPSATPAWFEVEGNVYAARFYGPLTGDVTGNCSGSAGSVAWGNVTGKPNRAGSSSDGGDANSARAVRTYGSDVQLGTSGTSSDDSGDIVFLYGNGQEKARLWTNNTYTSESGLNFRMYKADGTLLFTGTIPLRNTWRGYQTKQYSYSWSGSCTNGSVVNVTAANFGKTAISGYTPVGIVQIHNAAGFVCNDIDITVNSGNVARFRNVSGSTITSGNFEITVLYLQN